MPEETVNSLTLTPVQRRVLGVLMEKSGTTPEQYPLSLNAIVAGCNQKTNRDPVVAYSESDVSDAVQELRHKGLVSTAEAKMGSRVYRYKHETASKLGWSPRESAVLAELMLRGPQTPGELRSRADRMAKMPDVQFVLGVLNELTSADPPLVRMLSREPGRSAERYAHMFYGEDERPVAATVAAASPPVTNDLANRVDELESRLAGLEARVARLAGE